MDNSRILLVDDEEDILEMIKYNLEKDSHIVETASNGESALTIVSDFQPHLIILDIMMPGMDGIEVCQSLRTKPELSDTLIAFLTARSESFTHVSALESGGDDFITKPIKPNVLKSRVRALLRRHNNYKKSSESSIKEFGNLKIDSDRFTILIDDKEIALAKKEFELLKLLTSKPGKVFKRHEIMQKVCNTTNV